MTKKIKNVFKFFYNYPFNYALLFTFKYLFGNFTKVKLPSYKTYLSLRKNSTDFKVFEQIFLNNEYNINWDKKSKVVIDGGANTGFFSVKIKNELPDVKIICIEPDKENFEMMQKNLADYTNVFYENCGIWSNDTKLKVYDKYNLGKWGMVVEEDIDNGTIKAISINTILSKFNIDYIDVLKLDIESSEKELFSKNYENWLPKVKMIVIEFHDGFIDGCSKTFFEAINKTYSSYSISVRGENIIIKNNDLIIY